MRFVVASGECPFKLKLTIVPEMEPLQAERGMPVRRKMAHPVLFYSLPQVSGALCSMPKPLSASAEPIRQHIAQCDIIMMKSN